MFLAGCAAPAEVPHVDLQVECPGREVDAGLETAREQIVFRQRFLVSGGGCPELRAELIRTPPSGLLLRVFASFPGDPGPPGNEGPSYTVVIRGVEPGTHRLRVVHVLTGSGGGMPAGQGSDRPVRVRVALDHPVLVLPSPHPSDPNGPSEDR